jgi:hypothetical protein
MRRALQHTGRGVPGVDGQFYIRDAQFGAANGCPATDDERSETPYGRLDSADTLFGEPNGRLAP